MLNNLRPVFIIASREIRDQLRDWRIIFPVVGLTLFFPFLMNFTAQQMLGFVQKYGATIVGERLVPFLLMIVGFFPISVSLVIALESFVGEKERGSIEPLLNTPLQDWQLYLGKLLSSTVPPLTSSFLGMAVYLGGLRIQNIPWPETPMMILIVLLTIVQAIVMVSGAVVVSCQATSVRAANLLASFIVIPVALLIQGESILMFWGTYSTLWWAVFGLMVMAALLVRVGLAHFQREELLGREIDVLNARWIWRVFKKSFWGDVRSLADWYRFEISKTIRSMRISILITFVLALVGILLGADLIHQFFIPLDQESLAELDERIGLLVKAWPVFAVKPVMSIWWQNVRVLILAMVLGTFSFSILGVLPLMASMGAVGYLMALLTVNGIPAVTTLAFILPHAVIEVPAAILATAAILRAGVIMGTPTPDRTVGEVWIESIAIWTKIMAGVVIPMLLLAAAIEAWITPRLALLLVK